MFCLPEAVGLLPTTEFFFYLSRFLRVMLLAKDSRVFLYS